MFIISEKRFLSMLIIAILFTIFMIILVLALTVANVTNSKQADQIKVLTAENASLKAKLYAADEKLYNAAFRQVLREWEDADKR
jgi:cell division protein FtsB